MKKLIKIHEKLYQTQFTSLYTAHTVGYFLIREEGNILIDAPMNILDYSKQLTQLGGVSMHYFTHKHKTLPTSILQQLEEQFGCKTQRPGTWSWSPSDDALEKKEVAKDLEIIYAPGHTADSVIINWIYDHNNNWFTGDTLFVIKDQLARTTAFSDDNQQLNKTFELLKSLLPKHIYGSVSYDSTAFNLEIKDKVSWQQQLTACQKLTSY